MGFLRKLFNRTIVSTTRKRTVLKEYKVFLDDFPFECVIAGGTLRDYFLEGRINAKVDVDIFFLSEEEKEKAKEWLDNVINGDNIARLALKDIEYYTVPNSDITVNFVFYKTFSTVYNIINSFDFSVCSIAIYKDKVYFNDRFFKDLYDKNIYINNLEKQVSALYRLSKYKEKGFTVSKQLIKKVFEFNRKNPDRLFKGWDGYDNTISFDVKKACKILGIDITCKLKRITFNGR